ncbi:tRNA modification GTPase trmE [Thermodesulfitimonas autotrophica]|uniref:tRNA modification GTPase MnmE n=1 Tax=Thermodesulfitimonas autotrophica TaxID=1894989 RepID=A0A3N5APL1_9THEO|nr:tRNA uridine-5-carboxymethylaminomethyl(34) synthesis GTPase MnmE [Thermodesulfitimonas autotrophica]RPF47176.1 tRNA modification GTPase trmE [Thermodesulfitimonas autotrophica]
MQGDTIAAIATPLGEGGVGIVKVSGPDAVTIASKVFRPKKNRKWAEGPAYRLVYGHVVDPQTGVVIDEVLLSFMRAPYSYTTEDVVEFNCHGGFVAVQQVLEVILRAGARLAEPGEFTQRAFLGGRIDLCQAEAVLDVIRAATAEGLRVAQGQLGGRLTAAVRKLRQEALELLAAVEAGIDFPDDVPGPEPAEIARRVERLLKQGEVMIENAAAGAVYRDGVVTVLAGKANVGKSSLLNALAGRERAIVSAVPGTTRDIIEEVVNVKGIPLRVLDTAGIRDAVEEVEKIGVERAREALGAAQLVIVVLDAVTGITAEDVAVFAACDGQERVVAVNKVDVAGRETITRAEIEALAGEVPVVYVSAVTGEGLTELGDAIAGKVFGGRVLRPDEVVVSRARHKEALRRFVAALRAARDGVAGGLPEDVVSLDLRRAVDALGEITGETVTEDVVERIFRDFCVGK